MLHQLRTKVLLYISRPDEYREQLKDMLNETEGVFMCWGITPADLINADIFEPLTDEEMGVLAALVEEAMIEKFGDDWSEVLNVAYKKMRSLPESGGEYSPQESEKS